LNPARLFRKSLSNRGGSGNWPWKLEVVAVAEGKTPTAATAGKKLVLESGHKIIVFVFKEESGVLASTLALMLLVRVSEAKAKRGTKGTLLRD
jgi:hypothetical protein